MHEKQPTLLRAPLLYLLAGMISGLLLSKFTTVHTGLLIGLATALGLLALLRNQHQWQWTASFLTAATLLFWAYGLVRLPQTPDQRTLALPEREAMLVLDVQRIFQPKSTHGSTSGIAMVREAPELSRIRPGASIYFRLKPDESSSLTIQRGQWLQTTGVLTPLPTPNTPKKRSFQTYLKDIGVHHRFDRNGAITMLRSSSGFDHFCQQMNARFQDFLQLGSPPESELSNVYQAMLLGRKVALSKDQSERYRMTGTMHFFAISGLHIGVIATVIAQGLALLRVPRRMSPFIGLPLLYLYVEITGAPPSAVRAFLMTLFFWASFAFQRQRSPFAALVASAAFVLLIQPAQLWSVGFQLSYAVVLSILLLGLPLYQIIRERLQLFRWLPQSDWAIWQRSIHWFLDKLALLFAISFSAWLASTPLSAGLFEFIAPGAIVLNMLLVNLAALVISGGVIALTAALLYVPWLCSFINHSAWLVLSAMDALVVLWTKLPGAILPCKGFSLWISYGALGLFFGLLFLHHFRSKRAHGWFLIGAPIALLIAVGLGYSTSSI